MAWTRAWIFLLGTAKKIITTLVGKSPGLVVMGGDACSKGRGFKSRNQILDGHNIFSHIFVVRIVIFA